MRLIDADALKKDLKSVTLSNGTLVNTNAVLYLLEEYPTAYDVDKVVRQLEKVAFERYGNDGMGGEMVVNMDDAIDIVKGEYATEQSCEWELEDVESNLYVTGCENRELIFEGTPEENGYKFCHYCGRKIKRGGVD